MFVGGLRADTFILGESSRVYYDDGIASTAGNDAYAFLWDFEAGTDKIQLSGSADDYLLTVNSPGLPSGTAIWHDDTVDELVAVLNGVSGLDLASNDFLFVV